MTVTNGMAMSDRTPTKHEHFKKLLGMHVDIVYRTILKYAWRPSIYQYIDLNAGAGRVVYEDGMQGITSGLRAVLKLYYMQESVPPLAYRAYLIDNYSPNCDSLRTHWAIKDNPDVTVYCENNQEAIQRIVIPRNSLGLVCSDSNTLMGDLDIFDRLAARSEFDKMDFLIYLSASNYKRDQHANGREYLLDRLARIKSHWYVQEPYDKHQKTFLLGSDWDGFKEWRKLKFAPLHSDAGREYMERINLTGKERFLAHQAGLPIGVMPNISGIPAFEPSAPKPSSDAAEYASVARRAE
jgi:hypothetical protein